VARFVRRVWWLLGPGTHRGPATWWAFQGVAIAVLVTVLSFDGKWWLVPIAVPIVALSAYHTRRAIIRRKYF